METLSKKRRIITLDVKMQIINASATEKLKQLSEQFTMPMSTVRTILNNRLSILGAIEEGGEPKRSHLNPVKHEDLEVAVLRWLKALRSENVPMSGPLLVEKAKQLAKELAKPIRKALQNTSRPLEETTLKLEKKVDDLKKFKASDGWLSGFKQRHSIVFKMNQGEAADIDLDALGNWQLDVLRNDISRFFADDVFNADETGLFWQLLPNKTLAFKGERCTSGRKSKERVTVLVGANMSGSEKLPLLVIGKSAKPRAFKNKEIPVAYKANNKAWITADMFETWLKEWDLKLKRDGRKVLLYLDNFSGHSKIQLDQITLRFLPPNTTAASQPCDQGIIQNLKVHYRRFFLRERISAIDNKIDFKMDLYKSLRFLHRSWSVVKPETIANCFRKAGFIKNIINGTLEDIDAEVQPMEESQIAELLGELEQPEEADELNTLWTGLQRMNLVEGTLGEYLVVDDQLAIGGTLTQAEIAVDVSTAEVEEPEAESDTDVMEVDEEAVPPVNFREATAGFKLFQRYVEENFSDPAGLQMCDKLDDFLAKDR